MCHVFASTDPELFEPVTRSVRIAGVVTSLRLEGAFWRIIDEIARSSDMSTGRFLSTLHDEVVEIRGDVGNFASLLRVDRLSLDLRRSHRHCRSAHPGDDPNRGRVTPRSRRILGVRRPVGDHSAQGEWRTSGRARK